MKFNSITFINNRIKPLWHRLRQAECRPQIDKGVPYRAVQHTLFFVICRWKSISTNFIMQCTWLAAKNDNYITCKCYSRQYQTDKNNKPPWFFNRWRWFRRQHRQKIRRCVSVLKGSMILTLFHTQIMRES